MQWFRRKKKTASDATDTHVPQTLPAVSQQPTPAPPLTASPQTQPTPPTPEVAGRKPGLHLADQHGLTPPELLMLSYAPGYTTDTSDFQGFWEYQYGVPAPDRMLNSLVDQGFLIVGGPEHAAASQTGATLKDVLREHGQKVSGKKAELVDRVLETVPIDALAARFPQSHYRRTDLGDAALADSPHVYYAHSRLLDGIDIFTLTRMVQEHPGRPWRGLVWGHLNQQALGHAQDGNWGLARNCRYSMARFLTEEHRYADAVAMLAAVSHSDLSGMSNGFSLDNLWIYGPGYFPYSESSVKLPPGLVSDMRDWADRAGLSEQEIGEVAAHRISKLSMKFQLFTDQEVVQIIIAELQSDTETLEEIYALATTRFDHNYPGMRDPSWHQR